MKSLATLRLDRSNENPYVRNGAAKLGLLINLATSYITVLQKNFGGKQMSSVCETCVQKKTFSYATVLLLYKIMFVT